MATFVQFLAFNLFYAGFPLHTTRGLEWSPGQLGVFFALMSGAMFIVQGPLLDAIAKSVSPRGVFALGIGGLIAAQLVFNSDRSWLL